MRPAPLTERTFGLQARSLEPGIIFTKVRRVILHDTTGKTRHQW